MRYFSVPSNASFTMSKTLNLSIVSNKKGDYCPHKIDAKIHIFFNIARKNLHSVSQSKKLFKI